MILTTEETQWVADRMKMYDIKYQEIYYEILDHILTAIELKRGNGDNREIAVVFQDVVDTDFGGYMGIETLAIQQEQIYRKFVGGTSSKILGKNLSDWRIWAFTLLASALAYKLPDTKTMHGVFFVVILLLAFTPLIYTFTLISSNVKTIKGKQSLLKAHLMSQTFLPGMLLNGIIYIPSFFSGFVDGENGFKLMLRWPMPALMVVLIFFAVLNLSVINLCRLILDKRSIS
ncbi:hypothetical protein [Mucilaginibacter glaciei]|uniref:Uncharacterized protein n=1 Tax=Mucilaginibacter glaciei TaxID=2772109 RepID=A0A926NVF8_9SPHI|nr:hypothetical protein [Mucilaginibacter glaciei]MBD1392518.1 hypothetical protein [Mucilaginibacter glaciei]